MSQKFSGDGLKGIFTELLKSLLHKFNRKLVYVPRGCVWGADLKEDLSVLIPGMSPVCFDIGANTGQTLDLLEQTLNAPFIYAFEPSPSIFLELNERYGSNEHYRLFNTAMGSDKSLKEFYTYKSGDLSSFLKFAENKENRFFGGDIESVDTVEVQTVDEMVKSEKISRIDLLKSDTQGYDLNVLTGAAVSFEKGLILYVLVELNFYELYEGQSSATKIIDFLSGHGLQLVDFYEKERVDQEIAWCTALFKKHSGE